MSEAKEFTVGDRVRVVALPPYIKTAEPMPMLRPPNVVRLGEEGIVLDRRPGGYWGVRFARGAFLMESQYLETVQFAADFSSLTHTATQEGLISPQIE
jgi:hypothetical protein